MRSQTHRAGSVRHSEKRRTSTCTFADRIARVSIEEFHRRVPLQWRQENKQVCLATIVAHFRPISKVDRGKKRSFVGSSTEKEAHDLDLGGDIHDYGNGEGDNALAGERDGVNEHMTTSEEHKLGKMKVMALGVGTKFLSESKIRAEEKINTHDSNDDHDPGNSRGMLSSYGMRLRDSHAEVLARRAFRRALTLEMMALTAADDLPNNHDSGRNHNICLEYGGAILRRINAGGEDKRDAANMTKKKFCLVEGVTLHLYTSSTPCGNSSLKKFSKMTKEKFDASISPDQWPKNRPHGTFNAHSRHLGQCSLLVKKNNPKKKSDAYPVKNDIEMTKNTMNDSHIHRKERKWPANLSDDWCPPGTTLPHFGRGSLHSCSDKICRWNCIGIQGSLLASLLDKPLYIDSMTVGRKFTRCICERAVCCRAHGYWGGNSLGGTSDNTDEDITFHTNDKQRIDDEKGDGGDGEITLSNHRGNYFHLNHPVIMGTGVYLDASGTIDMSGSKTVGQDVRFLSNLCWVWWSNPSSSYADGKSDGLQLFDAECVDGEEGLLHCYKDCASVAAAESGVSDSENNFKRQGNDNIISAVSTYALYKIFLKLNSEDDCHKGDVSNADEAGLNGGKDISLSLEDLRALKRCLSPSYEIAKDNLLHKHGIFYQWSRRCSHTK